MFSSDPVIDYLYREIELERKLHRLPVCSICGEHIQQDTALKLYGEWICDGCIDSNREFTDEEDFEDVL